MKSTTMLVPLILHFNTKEHTENLCRELPEAIVIANCENPDLEVDNCIIHLEKNHGFSEGWNKGIEAAMKLTKASHFWLCNSDIIPYKDCFAQLQAACEVTEYGIFTPNYNCWNGNVRHKPNNGKFTPKNTENKTIFRPVKYIEFTAPIISRETFEKVGLFDSENFNNGYGVEYDFCYRAAKLGIQAGVFDAAEFYHIRQQSIKRLPNPELFINEADLQSRKLFAKHKQQLFYNYPFVLNFNQRAAVYVTIFGKYDKLRSMPEQSVDVDLICICDVEPDYENQQAKEQWKVIKVPRNPLYGNSDRMQAKYYKCVPFDTPELKIYDNLIFIDASIKVQHRDFVRLMLSSLDNNRFTLCAHPHRTDIFNEAIVSEGLAKYRGLAIRQQAEIYRHDGFESQVPLFACGIMVRNIRSKVVQDVCRTWLGECVKRTFQDQISFPYCCWKYNFQPTALPISAKYRNQYDSDYWKIFWNPK